MIEFYASMTMSPGDIRDLCHNLEECGRLEAVSNVIFTPISADSTTEETIMEIRSEYDSNVMFDSGGYEVQVGNKEFSELYDFLYDYFRQNQDVHRYVLPDDVPMSDDPEDVVDMKVKKTISASRRLYSRLPDKIKDRTMAVVQGRNMKQINRCLDEYINSLEVEQVGFGSFDTGGGSGGINMISQDSVDLLEHVVERCHNHGIDVHAFGVGGPTSIPVVHNAGVDSFDTSSWITNAGYGNAFFPFKSRMNVSHRKSRSGATLTSDRLSDLKEETGHECNFCNEIETLQDSRMSRAVHNILVIDDMCSMVEEYSYDRIKELMGSSNYRKLL